MSDLRARGTGALAGLTLVGAAFAGIGTVSADADTTTAPVTTVAVAPPSDPAVAPVLPPDTPVGHQKIPEIPNPGYAADQNSGGIFGTLKDLWHQVQDATLQDQVMGSSTPGAVPAVPGAVAPPTVITATPTS